MNFLQMISSLHNLLLFVISSFSYDLKISPIGENIVYLSKSRGLK